MLLAALSLMFPPLERCSGNVQPDRHVTAVLWEREQSSSHPPPAAAAIAVSLLHRAKARHPALCFPAGVPTHLSTDIIHQDCAEYTRFLRDRRGTFRNFVRCIRFISNKRRSLAVHGELYAHLTCCCSSL
ncbi:hypothetical protein QQF64_023100 [Cirrhinus molitorella]|uniref:Secreted protein n=1 Tax=Cirrhinus molitorella TaxID=172907 RepID=A0ABR3L7S1_9TELE